MAEISGGGLHFTSTMDNSQLNKAVDETLRRLQGLSEGAVAAGDAMDTATAELVEQINIQKKVIQELEASYNDLNDRINSIEPGTAQDTLIEQANAVKQELDGERQGLAELTRQLSELSTANTAAASSMEDIRSTLSTIGAACEMNENAITKLRSEYLSLQKAMSNALEAGDDDEYQSLKKKAEAIRAEFAVRKQLLHELREQSNALEESAGKIEKERQAVEQNANAHVSLRKRIKELKAEMADYQMQFGDQTEEYKKMASELGNLQDIQGDINAQGSILSNDESQFAGILSGLNGIVGGFTAAQGAVALFAGENENLQKIMTKVQALMSVTIGMQQVAQTLNKDSAFSLVTLNGLKEWWNKLTGQSVVEETAETAATATNTAANTANAASQTARTTATAGASVATGANTAATGANTAAAGAGTVANWSLAASFRGIAASIKAIPMFGWIAAGITALIAAVTLFNDSEDENTEAVKKNKEAQKDLQEELTATERVHAEAIKQAAEERGKIQLLNSIVHDNTVAIGDRRKALNELKRIIPSYNALLDSEGRLTRDNTRAIDEYINALDRQAMAKAAQKELEALSTKEVQNKLTQRRNQRQMDKNQWANDYVNPNDAINRDNGYENTAVRDNTAVREEAYQTQKTEAAKARAAYSKAEQDMKAAKKAAQKIAQDKAEIMSLIKDEGLTSDVVATSIPDEGKSGAKTSPLATPKVETELEKLEKLLAKAKQGYSEYYKWLNSGDKVLQESAEQEFAGLLAQGKTYLDYLNRQREEILKVDAGKRTSNQTDTLRKLNEEIANETKATVLETFSNELSAQLGNAQSIIEMLNIIEQRRKELKSDGTELDNNKKDVLDDAEQNVVEKQKERTSQLLEDYASYTTRKLKLEREYIEDMMLLQKQLDKAQTPQEKDSVEKAMDNRRTKYNNDNKGTGDETFDALKEQYRTFQEKVTAIKDEYEEKRRVATLHNDTALLNQLATAEANELSKLQSDMITNSVDWQKLFGNLDELSSKSIKRLIGKIEAQKIQFSADFNPEDLKAINDQLEKARETIDKRNPFKALGNAYKQLRETIANNKLLDEGDPFVQELNAKKEEYEQYQAYVSSGNTTLAEEGEKAFSELLKSGSTYLEYLKRKKQELQGKINMRIDTGNSMQILDAVIKQEEAGKSKSDMMRESLKDTFSSAASSVSFVKGCFDSVTDGIKQMGGSMDEESEQIMGDIGGMLDGAAQFAEGYATMNPMQMIQGTVGFLSSAFDLFNSSDRKAEKSIKKHKEAIEDLQTAYEQLEWAVDKALGGEVYTNQKAMIQNMKEQQEHLRGMIDDENSKKHTDGDKIKEYKNQIAELDRQIQDMYDAIAQDILQTDAKTFASELGDALVDAFGKGEDAAEAFESTVNGILKNAVLNQLKKNFLEKELQGALDKLQEDMGYWNGDNFVFDGLTDAEKAAFKNQVKGITAGFEEAMKMYEDLFKDITEETDTDTSLTGSVKGVSEETASQVAGQMNAIRINQMEATEMLRQQLAALSAIARNTAYNFHLAKIDRIVSLLESRANDPSLRSQGLS